MIEIAKIALVVVFSLVGLSVIALFALSGFYHYRETVRVQREIENGTFDEEEELRRINYGIDV